MKKKKQRKLNIRLFTSISLILCILFSSFPVYVISAETEHFIGINDIEIEENTQFSLLEGVSAYDADNANLEVTVASVVCQTDSAFVYDNSNVLTVGTAGSEYIVEYTAVSQKEEGVTYTGMRKITSVQSPDAEITPESETTPETESTPELEITPEAESKPETEEMPKTEESTQGETAEFDEDKPFTISELEGMGYHVEMDGAKIPIKNFKLQCLYEKAGEIPCDDLRFAAGTKYIDGGKIKDHAPRFVSNGGNKLHSYVKAHVGEVSVYYMGTLHIEKGDGTEEDYVYYTTDTQITNKTVYAVLKEKEQEKITLTYSHEADYKVEYQMFEKGDHNIEQGPDGWSYSDVFGEDRAISVKKGQEASVTVKIPRGYKAEISVVRKGQTPEHLETLGQMMAYERDGNHISLKAGSPSSMIYETSFNLKNIESDFVITLEYEKVDEIHFNAYMWTQTDYAKNRMQIHGKQKPTEDNSNLKTDGHSFVWEWDGVTSKGDQIDGGDGTVKFHTWELDQLELNGEALIIPMVSLNDINKTITEKTTLSSGTEVTLSVTSKGGTNAYDGRRHYKLELNNCYEDVTISGGNMVAHRHQEYAIRELAGVVDPGFYAATDAAGNPQEWQTMRQDTLIAKIGYSNKNKWTDPFRFKRETGYYKPDISFMTKEGVVLQKNYKLGFDEDGDGEKYIQYLIRTDTGNTGDTSVMGTYREVSWDDWEESADGYYYFRGTDEVKEYAGKPYTQDPGHMPEKASHGVVLVNINARPIRIGLDYLAGGDDQGKTAPKAENIVNLPEIQYGGPNGYNLVNNPRILVSNLIPVDLNNEFVFDHWEIMETTRGEGDEKFWGYLTGEVRKDTQGNPYIARTGQEYYLDVPTLNHLENCFYMKGDPGSGDTTGNPFNDKPHKGAQTHAIITVRAVWKKHESKPTIPYTVKYITAEVKDGKIDTDTETIIEERTHTVNEGAMLVTDLYQDGSKTPSASIQAVLKGENPQKEDYTRDGLVRWVVYEPKTTKMIEHVNMKNNEAIIYLIKGNTKVNVEKAWASADHTEQEVTVQLQRRKTDQDIWEKVETISLSKDNKWEHQFDADTYYDLPSDEHGLLKTWKYRVVEVNGNGDVIEDGRNIAINNNTYQVGYRYDDKKDAWVVKNTRLLDLTISKVVEGKYGDHTKEFIFDIQAADSSGNALTGDYNYIGSVKQGYEDQAQSPKDGTLTFKEGKAQIKLKHGQQITIQNVPVNAKITVIERKADGYTTSYTVNGEKKNTGELILTKNSTVDVTNEKSDIADTGITNKISGVRTGIGIVVIAILSFGALALLRLKKERKR
ncbi:MAG: hypothetical protein Q4C97_05070 [Bacillota bacterium]|nr:hypothetical protein [Bacillota bacterium]